MRGGEIKTPGGRPRILIVGSGLAGTATAIRLLRAAMIPVEILIWERRPEFRAGGPAYNRDGNPWNYIFNIQAGRMSLFREDTFDFLRWANTEADRSHWPSRWRNVELTEHGPAPRRIFQDYLQDRLCEARAQALQGVSLTEVDGEVIDLIPGDRRVGVVAKRISPTSRFELAEQLAVEHVVVATGLELRSPTYARRVVKHPLFVREPYSAHGAEALESVPTRATIVVIGSVLSAYDAASLLLERGHRGDVYIISGSGTRLRAYPTRHTHGVIALPPPKFHTAEFLGRDAFLTAVKREWSAACSMTRESHPELPESIIPERVAKAWEPHAPEVLRQLPDEVLRSILDDFGTEIAALRVGAMADTTEPVDAALNRGEWLHQIVGTVKDVLPTPDGRLAVVIHSAVAERRIEADLVIDSFGREPNYAQVESPLWRNLVARGLATPHRRTGRGLEVDERGRMVDSRGEPSRRISLVGALREGDEIIRNGRSGAFPFNLAAIKNHSLSVAMDVLESIEFPEAAPCVDSEDTAQVLSHLELTGVRTLVEDAVNLEINRQASAQSIRRKKLAGRIDACIARLVQDIEHTALDCGPLEEVLKIAIRREAVRRLTDVSVTPKDLRRILALGE